jgi:dUTP pyrophosphatase
MRGFKKVSTKSNHEHVVLPARSTKGSAGYDFVSPVDVVIPAKGMVKIKSGIKAYMQPDECLFLYPRSSWGIKHSIMITNTVGVVDSDYYNNPDNEGEIIVALTNMSDNDFEVKKGDRMCQAVFKKILLAEDDVADQERKGGIGSTDAQ